LPGYVEAARGAALLVPPADPAALAEALWRVSLDHELRARLAARGHARAGALSWARIAARVAHVYEAAIAERSPLLVQAPQPA
jgi:glycosyltransferase involved in cell wall biosynthesis